MIIKSKNSYLILINSSGLCKLNYEFITIQRILAV